MKEESEKKESTALYNIIVYQCHCNSTPDENWMSVEIILRKDIDLLFPPLYYSWNRWTHYPRTEKSTAPGIPKQSPIQVLTGLDIAWLQWSDENWYFQCDMAVDTRLGTFGPSDSCLCVDCFMLNIFRHCWTSCFGIWVNKTVFCGWSGGGMSCSFGNRCCSMFKHRCCWIVLILQIRNWVRKPVRVVLISASYLPCRRARNSVTCHRGPMDKASAS